LSGVSNTTPARARDLYFVSNHCVERVVSPRHSWLATGGRRVKHLFGSRHHLVGRKTSLIYLYWEGEQGYPKFFAFNLHPFVSGVPYRTKVIEEFIRYAQGFPKVWFARRLEIANWWLERGY
jgi:hypothetical protein